MDIYRTKFLSIVKSQKISTCVQNKEISPASKSDLPGKNVLQGVEETPLWEKSMSNCCHKKIEHILNTWFKNIIRF